jgi:hypothetical protein
MMKKLKVLWLSYQLYSARKNAEVEEFAAVAASHNARYFHLRAIDLQSKLDLR